MSNGDLYVYKTNPSDGYKSYGCRTVHTLTGEVQTSSYSGRIIVSGQWAFAEKYMPTAHPKH